MSKSTDDLSSTCPLCYQDVKIYAIGSCDHTICHVCSTRMRALCDQMYCPVCRADLHQVVFMNKYHLFKGIITHRFPRDRDTKISFQNNRVRLEFNILLQHQCTICVNRTSDGNFRMLQDHMRKDHELFYCDLCVEYLKIFTSERKCYTRKDLAQHRRKGDPDDTSYKGHPLCEFCDKRYFDNDELLKHLRRDHYFCHFCESTGISNQYYNDYESLKDHFQASHYLCDEGDCEFEQFSHAFASDIDLKAHRAAVHSKTFSKFQARQNRQIDVEINLPPRTRDRRGGGPSMGRGRAHLLRDDNGGDDDTFRAIQASLQTSRAEDDDNRRRQKEEKVRRKNNRKAPDECAEEAMDVRCSELNGEENFRPNRNNQTKAPEKIGFKDNNKKEESTTAHVKRTEKDFPKLLDQSVDHNNSPFVSSWGKPNVGPEDFPGLNPSTKVVAQPPPKRTQTKAAEKIRSKDNNKKEESTSAHVKRTEKDFPKLLDQSVDHNSPFVSSWGKPNMRPEDFPGLNPSAKVVASSSSQKPNSDSSWQPPQMAGSLKEYPVLSSGVDKLGGRSKSSTSATASQKVQSKVHKSMGNSHHAPPVSRQVPPATAGHPSNFQAKSGEFPSLSSIATFLNKDVASNKQREKVADRQSEWKRPVIERGTAAAAPSKKEPKKSEHLVNTKTEEDIRSVRPPPGFGSQSSSAFSGPPPGFGSMQASSVKQLSSFVPLDDYKDRNRALVHRIKKSLKDKDGGFDRFRTLSGQFRTNLLGAQEYYDECLSLLGDSFGKIFEELVSLLPDVEKQEELVIVHSIKMHRKSQGDYDRSRISKNSSTAGWKDSPQNKHKTCTQCRQIVLLKDFEDHLNTHQDFPALTSTAPIKSKSGIPPHSAWGRMK